MVEGGARAITMVFAATRLLCPSAGKSKAPVGVGVHVVAHAACDDPFAHATADENVGAIARATTRDFAAI